MGKHDIQWSKTWCPKDVDVLIQQPEVDAKRITLLGHKEGGEIVTRITIDNPKTTIEYSTFGSKDWETQWSAYYGLVVFPLEYAKQVLDKNHDGLFSLKQASQDQTFQNLIGGNPSSISQ